MKYLAGIAIGATALALMCSAPGTARSQDFPNRVVTVTIPYAPGGSAEASLRPVADALSKNWKQPVIIESQGWRRHDHRRRLHRRAEARRLPAALHGDRRAHHLAQACSAA